MEQFIMANDTALRISDSGRGETTLALLHGYLESLEVWEDLAKRLAPYYRIVAIDIPGHGISQVRGEVHTMDFVADTLQAVLEKLGVRRCFLAGHSMGGYAAEAFAERHSDMLQGLILFHSTPNADTEQKKADRLREIELFRADKKELLASQFAPKGFAEENRRRLRDRIGQLEELTAATDDDGIVDIDTSPERFAEMLSGRFGGDLRRLTTAYFDKLIRMVEAGGFDFVGHVDKISYNAERCEPGITSRGWYRDKARECFERIAARGLMVEINTKKYNACGVFFPNREHFGLLRELRIPVLVNSDAHRPELIDDGRHEAMAALREAGIREVIERVGNRWVPVEIVL